jgi:hypothetical protein
LGAIHMRRVLSFALVACLATGATLAADQGKSNKDKKGKQTRADAEPVTHVGVHVAFGSTDVVILRDHYEPRYRRLPPGLQKKVARGGELPPGWKKKFEPFPVAIEHRLPPLPAGYRRGVIDAHAVIYNTRTNVIVDVAVLF